jgi:glycosyltransferase involved in cell wall biosynthesis
MVDDGSSDRTVEVARSYQDGRITITRDGAHRGLAARLNEIVATCQGKYFARMDSDDIAYPHRLERQVQYLEEQPDLDLVGTSMAVFGQDGLLLGKRSVPCHHGAICERPYTGIHLGHPTFMGKLEWFKRHPYRVSAVRCEDQDLLLRTHETSRFGNISDILLGYREDRISARKILTSRWYYAMALSQEFRNRGKYVVAAWATFLQLAKAGLDSVAVATRLDHKVLRHRARPVNVAERSEWDSVWRLVNGDGGNVQR